MTDPFILTTPVAFFIFNRPAVTERVFQAIRSARPAKLFVVADGPRDDRPGEAEKCAACREIVERIDWPCEVERNYSDINLGCRRRVSSGIDWVFSIAEEAIILEDDCLPEPSFFRFSEEMLDYYRNDDRIMMVCGTNVLGQWRSTKQNYHFSYYGGVWGWATWRRAWRHYDVDMKAWQDSEVKSYIAGLLGSPREYRLRAGMFDKVAAGKIDTWDFQWSFARLARGGLSVVPSVNLISNIGFGNDATHTTNAATSLSAMATRPVSFPLEHLQTVMVDRAYDEAFIQVVTSQQTLLNRIKDVSRIVLRRIKKLAGR